MPLSPEIQQESYDTLYSLLESLGEVTPKKRELLRAIITKAAQDEYALHLQDQIIDNVLAQINNADVNTDAEEFATVLYATIEHDFEKQKEENKGKYGARKGYSRKPIYTRNLTDELQDHDMTRLMPKSNDQVEVLAVLDTTDQASMNVVGNEVGKAISNPRVKHIIIPVGPGHWRGIYINKPSDGESAYQVELFDPMGKAGAAAIDNLSYKLLSECGIKDIVITHKGPIKPQKDFYACGDFTCAYSHKKMQEFGASSSEYREDLIEVLDKDGNKNNVLRKKIRSISKETELPGTSVDSSMPQAKPAKNAFLASLFPSRERATAETKPVKEIEVPAAPTMETLNPADADETKQLAALRNTINQATSDYLTHSNKTWFSIFHRHGETGRKRAIDLREGLAQIDELQPLRNILFSHLSDPKEGNTHPHSFRTILLQQLMTDDKNTPKLSEVSKNYDQYLDQLADKLNVNKDTPGRDRRLK